MLFECEQPFVTSHRTRETRFSGGWGRKHFIKGALISLLAPSQGLFPSGTLIGDRTLFRAFTVEKLFN